MCNDGVATSINCPLGHNFNEEVQICDLPQNYPCTEGEPVVPTTLAPPTTTEELLDESNVCHNRPNGYFVNNPAHCAAYWICDHEQAFEGSCLNDLNFNEELQVCDFQENFYCENSTDDDAETDAPETPIGEDATTTEDAPTTTTTPGLPFQCEADDIATYAIADSCTTYFLCFGGSVTIRKCAQGLHFDEVHGHCDLIERVRCLRGLCPAVNDADNIVTHPSENSCDE